MKIRNIFLFLLISSIFNAQSSTFIYEMQYKSNDKNDLTKIEKYYLDVVEKKSIFRSEKDRISDSLIEKTGFGLGSKMTLNNQFYVQKNLIKKSVIKNIIFPPLHDRYFIKITDELKWELLPDKVNIDELECQKATVNYAGRKWIAWFTESIPIQDGPYIFNGLPGLIVKISDENFDYIFNLVKVVNLDNMFPPMIGKEINWETYKNLQLNYYNNPFAEVKARNIKTQVADPSGNIITMNFKNITNNIQKQLKENNNPIEIDQKINY